ncbi:Zinc ABC transporter [uncultured virus]|nr:Zinc ABC transporter [uncultured virus]
MLAPFIFFYQNLSIKLQGVLVLCLVLHLYSHAKHLDTDKQLSKSISEILKDQSRFDNELPALILTNIGYLISYNIFMIAIEILGKSAVQIASQKATKRMLNAKLDSITDVEYEQKVNSIIHHNKNLLACVRNLFIEFPRKTIACYHFIIALYELSFEIMIYCSLVSLTFTLVSLGISYYRERLVSRITDHNTQFSVVAADVSNSIQSYKVDKRLSEYEDKFRDITSHIQYNSAVDSLMVGLGDASSGISSQFMIGLIAYMCRPYFLSGVLELKDLNYGIHSSSKFVEKLVGVIDHFGDVIRQYKSFHFFISINDVQVESQSKPQEIINLKVKTNTVNQNISVYKRTNRVTRDRSLFGGVVRIVGENGAGKTTILLKLLGVAYKGATSRGTIAPLSLKRGVNPESYRHTFGFIQQAVPITCDTIRSYVAAVANPYNTRLYLETTLDLPGGKNLLQVSEPLSCLPDNSLSNNSKLSPFDIINNSLVGFNVEERTRQNISKFLLSIGTEKRIKTLSGGQGKMIQILAAVAKCYYQQLSLIVMDEPSNNLDPEKVEYLIEIIKCLKANGVVVLLVTHDKRLLFDSEINNIQL